MHLLGKESGRNKQFTSKHSIPPNQPAQQGKGAAFKPVTTYHTFHSTGSCWSRDKHDQTIKVRNIWPCGFREMVPQTQHGSDGAPGAPGAGGCREGNTAFP